MKHTPSLPETSFQPLTEARLDAMINHALSHQQLPAHPSAGSNVIAFRKSWAQNLAFGTGMAAMAASILIAFMVTPQYSTFTPGTDVASTSDISDMLLLESFGA